MTFTPITTTSELPKGEVLAINSKNEIRTGRLRMKDGMTRCEGYFTVLTDVIAYIPAADLVMEFKKGQNV